MNNFILTLNLLFDLKKIHILYIAFNMIGISLTENLGVFSSKNTVFNTMSLPLFNVGGNKNIMIYCIYTMPLLRNAYYLK